MPFTQQSNLGSSATEQRYRLALEEIADVYGDLCRIKSKSLNKFGLSANADANVETTVMELPGATQYSETYITNNTNGIDRIVSSNNSDTGSYIIEGHTDNGEGLLTFVTQTVTLTGQTPATLSISLNRANRIKPTITNTSALLGNIQVYRSSGATVTGGVVSPDTNVHIQALAITGSQTSQKCATSISNVDYGIISDIVVGVNRAGSSARVDFKIKVRRAPNSVFTQVGPTLTIDSSSQTNFQEIFDPCIIVPKNSDVIVTATSNINDTPVRASLNIYLANIIS